MANDAPMRLNKFLARAGHGSRRAAEELVRQGRVSIDGEVVTDLGRQVAPATHTVAVDGVPAELPRDYRVYAFHKPLDVVSTLKSQGGQVCLEAYRLVAEIPERFVPVGRLDSESTGLLLWTDDGDLNQALCRPNTGVWKTYEVELGADLPPAKIPLLTDGKLHIDGRPCHPCQLEMAPDRTTRHWVMRLHEGRRRQIRRMFKKVGLKVVTLHRVAVGPIELGLLRPGDFRRLNHEEEQALRQAVSGPRNQGAKPRGKRGTKPRRPGGNRRR